MDRLAWVIHQGRRLAARLLTPPSAVYLGDGVVCARPTTGGYLYLDAEDRSVTPVIALSGEWEPAISHHFARRLRAGMHVVDVGANAGFYALMAGRRVGPAGSVRAIEPNARLVELMRRTFAANDLAWHCTALEGVALDREGEVDLGTYSGLEGSSSILINDRQDRPVAVRMFRAKARRLDDWLEPDLKVDILKIDAEGAEPLIWDGMSRVLEASRQLTIFMEFAPPMIAETCPPADFLQRIRQAGFRVQAIDFRTAALSEPAGSELLSRRWSELLLTRGGPGA